MTSAKNLCAGCQLSSLALFVRLYSLYENWIPSSLSGVVQSDEWLCYRSWISKRGSWGMTLAIDKETSKYLKIVFKMEWSSLVNREGASNIKVMIKLTMESTKNVHVAFFHLCSSVHAEMTKGCEWWMMIFSCCLGWNAETRWVLINVSSGADGGQKRGINQRTTAISALLLVLPLAHCDKQHVSCSIIKHGWEDNQNSASDTCINASKTILETHYSSI